MKDLLDAVISLPALVVALAVFSFVPGIVMPVMARIYPHDHPRRRDRIGPWNRMRTQGRSSMIAPTECRLTALGGAEPPTPAPPPPRPNG